MTTTTNAAASTTTTVPTRALLTAGAAAGPLWAIVSLAQAATRDGFDITRHPLSLLSTGSLGWLQIVNFVASGMLLLAGAAGLRRTLTSRWAPRLIAVAGVGMAAAGVLVMDPADGFPAGTPAGVPASMSWHSVGHMAAGSITFTALIAACYVLARHFGKAGRRGRALAAAVAGTALLIGNLWAMTGGAGGSLTLAIGATAALLHVSGTAAWSR